MSDAQTAALRAGAGAFLSPRDVLAVHGPDAESYLQGQLSQDVVALTVGQSADALLLQPDGKLLALVRVTRTDGQGFLLDVDAGFGDAVTARLRKFLLRTKVEMESLPWRCLSLRGAAVPEVAAGLHTALSEAGVLAIPYEWNGWSGVDFLGPKDLVLEPADGSLPAGVVAAAPEAVEACRITSGIPAMGAELTEKTIAAEAGLVERTVNFTKGCYIGQEIVERIRSRATVHRSLRQFELQGAAPTLGPGEKIELRAGDAAVGELTSVASIDLPGFSKTLALCVTRVEALEKSEIEPITYDGGTAIPLTAPPIPATE